MSDKLPELIGAPEGNTSPSLRQARATCRTFPSFQGVVDDALNDFFIQKIIQKRGLESCPAKNGAKKFQVIWDFLL
jgi:hypothetical protein